MGWWEELKDGKKLLLGDEPFDILADALDQVIKNYETEAGKKPNLDEVISVVKTLLVVKSSDLSKDPEGKILVDLVPKTVKAVTCTEGTIVALPLKDGSWGYGKVLLKRKNFNWMGFFDLRTRNLGTVGTLSSRKFALKFDCGDHAIKIGRWPVIGHVALTEEEKKEPVFRHIDLLDPKKAFLVTIDKNGDEVRKAASVKDVKDLPDAHSIGYLGIEELLTKRITIEP